MIEDFDRRFLAKLFSGHPRTRVSFSLFQFSFSSYPRKREILSSYVIGVLLSLSAQKALVPSFVFHWKIGFNLIYWMC